METGRSDDKRVLTFLWRIENVGLWKTDCGWNGLVSSWLRARSLEERAFALVLRPKGVRRNDEHLTLELMTYDSLSFPIDCEWSFIGSNGSPLVSGIMRKLVIVGNEAFKMSDCPTYEEVFVTKKSAFLPHDTLTVRFRIWSSDGELSNNELVSSRCRLETIDYFYLWPVPGFSALQLNQEVTNPIVLDDITGKGNFLLKFSLKGDSLEDAFANVEFTPITISTYFSVMLNVSVMGNIQNVMKSMDINSEEGSFVNGMKNLKRNSLILSKFASRKALLKEKNECLKNDVLTLRCVMLGLRYSVFNEKYYYGSPNLEVNSTKHSSTVLDKSSQNSEHHTETSEISLQSKDTLGILGEDLLILYKEQTMTDFKLRACDVTFPVHKIILSARSPVFRAMFSSDMKESVSNFQDVPDLDVHTMNRMLTFLYGDTVEPDLHLEGVAKLYYAADKYQILSLKQQCSFLMQSSIQVSNVSNILTVADRHEDKELTSFVHDFFLNNFDEIMQNEEWENFQQRNSALAGNTMLQIYKRKLHTKLA